MALTVLGDESLSALAEGLQETLGQQGGVPTEHKTDILQAAWKQQGEDGHRELTERYAALWHAGCAVGAMKMDRLKASTGI